MPLQITTGTKTMNPCKQHEKEDIDRHGSGFDCVYCRVEQLATALEKKSDEVVELEEQLAALADNYGDVSLEKRR